MRDIFQIMGVFAPLVTGMCGFKQWPWWIPITCIVASTVWYVSFTGFRVALRAFERSAPGAAWYFAQVPLFHVAAWLIGFAMWRFSA